MYFLAGIMALAGIALIIMGLILYKHCDEYDKIWADLFS